MSTSSWALVPWSIVPITATTITVPSNVTATVQYKVTNHSAKQHTLVMIPITGISQTTTGGGSGISTHVFTLPTGSGVCTSVFTLPSGASCTLSLQVNGSALTTNIIGGPQICQTDVNGQPDPQECYQPASPAEALNITTSGALAIGDSFGGGTVACLD